MQRQLRIPNKAAFPRCGASRAEIRSDPHASLRPAAKYSVYLQQPPLESTQTLDSSYDTNTGKENTPEMSTQAQQTASRHNGALSSGPISPDGKARSAQNATRHGLTGGPVVLPSESQEEYDAFLYSFTKAYRPRTLAELDRIQQMAAGQWRLRRIEHMEAAILNQAFERQMESMGDDADPDIAMERAYADVAENSKGWRNLDRHQRTLERSYQQSIKAYLELQEQVDHEVLTPSDPSVTTPQKTRLQNEPEPDYSSLKSLHAGDRKLPAFMPKMIAELRNMNSAGPEIHRKKT